ncbi:hypothetical protein DXG01_006828 [Tephrocybe rancida]|nr:hypothetical protein DXG01_006828 [Tephrocybe rancida]
MDYFRFPSFSVLVTATAGFTMLEDLSFDNVTWELADPPPLTLAPTDRMPMIPRHLQRLHIRSSPINPLLNWLFGHTVDPMDSQAALPQPIHTLILPDLLPNDIYIVGCLLRTLESTLRHFEVGFLVHNYDNSDMRSK